MYLTGIGCNDIDWTDVAQDRGWWRAFPSRVTNLRVP